MIISSERSGRGEEAHHAREGRARESGAVLVELALSFPVIVLIMFAGFEYSRILRIHQTLSSVTREVGREAFRDCAGFVNVNCAQAGNDNQCLESVAQRMRGLVAGTLRLGAPELSDRGTGGVYSPDIDVVLSIYRLDSGGQYELRGITPDTAGAGCDPLTQRCSKYTEGRIDGDASLEELRRILQQNEVLVVAEVYARYDIVSSDVLGVLLDGGSLDGLRTFYYSVFF